MAVVVAVGLICLVGCGGGSQGDGRPVVLDDMSRWMGEATDCDVGVEMSHLPVPASRAEEVPGSIERFAGEATTGASVECKTWLSGWISYYAFPSTQARIKAVSERAPLQRNQLYCAKGRQLIVNELLGYDETAGYCRRLGFPIHRPTRRRQRS
jgi:hypothetical protein